MQNTTDHTHHSWRTYVQILGSPLLVVAIVTCFAIAIVNLLGAVRAYGAGESMWSKARAEAVEHLLRYANNRSAADFDHYQRALEIPLSDRLAREGMEGSRPASREQIEHWLIRGGNHPDDVRDMVFLFRLFGNRWVLKQARETWAEGDRLITLLQDEAQALKRAIDAGAQPSDIQVHMARIDLINDQLTEAGIRFNQDLGDAARVTERLLIGGMAGMALILSLVSFWQVRQVLIEQQKHQSTLDLANRRWQLASSAGGFGLYEMEKATGIIHLDGKSAAMHGFPEEPTVVPRATIRSLIVPEDAEQTRYETDQALQYGEVYRIVYRVRHPDGQIRALEATGGLVRPGPGEAERLMGVLRDITDQLQQADLEKRRDAAVKVAQAQREFLSRLSHELRTPLNAILGFAQLLQMDRRHTTPTQQHQAGLIVDAGQQLLALIEDVLDLTKVESGHISIQLEATDVCTIGRNAASLLQGQIQNLGLHWRDDLPKSPIWAQADPQRLHQVLVNLLSNACKYNRSGGEVHLHAHAMDGQVIIEVKDTGHGMSQADLDELFQPFKRLDPSARVEGTGLGLYIVKQLVERMNGTVTVSSEPGQGSTFMITLPVASAPQASL